MPRRGGFGEAPALTKSMSREQQELTVWFGSERYYTTNAYYTEALGYIDRALPLATKESHNVLGVACELFCSANEVDQAIIYGVQAVGNASAVRYDYRTLSEALQPIDLHELLLALQQLAKTREDFFTNITHEFRTPLTVILGIAREMQDDGQSPKRYIMELRLSLARELMNEHPEYTLNDVAVRCGFYDHSHFVHAFRSVYGVAPSEALSADR